MSERIVTDVHLVLIDEVAKLREKVRYYEQERVPELIRHGTELLEQCRAADALAHGYRVTVELQAKKIAELEKVEEA
jgi:hypothetical protein